MGPVAPRWKSRVRSVPRGNPPRLDPTGAPARAVILPSGAGTHTVELQIDPAAPADCIHLIPNGSCEPNARGPWVEVYGDPTVSTRVAAAVPFKVTHGPQVKVTVDASHDQAFALERQDEVEPGQVEAYVLTAKLSQPAKRLELTATWTQEAVERAFRVSKGGKVSGNRITWNLPAGGKQVRVRFALLLKDAEALAPVNGQFTVKDLAVDVDAQATPKGAGDSPGTDQESRTLRVLVGSTVHDIGLLEGKEASGGGWNMTLGDAPGRSVEFLGVSFNGSLLAEQISVPYLFLTTTAMPEARIELNPLGGGGEHRSRLIRFKAGPSNAGQVVSVVATFAVDRIPDGSHSTLLLTQHSVFSTSATPEGQVNATFFPEVDYQFIPDTGESLSRVQVAERFLWDPAYTSPVLLNGSVPTAVETERQDRVILSGAQGGFGEVRQSQPETSGVIAIQWRNADGTLGIPAGSNQTVDLGIVRFRPGEDSPVTLEQLVDGDPVQDEQGVLWYVATGFQASDSFFSHGGSFVPGSKPSPSDTVSITGFVPDSAPPGTRVQIYGTGFKNVRKVTFGGRRAGHVSSSGQVIEVTVPDGAQTGPIVVVTKEGTATSADSFTVTPGP